MVEPISVILPDDVSKALDAYSRTEGVPPSEVIGRAVKQHIFLQRFRSLRERLSAKAQGQGVIGDQDVFDRVS